jgi:hypothetical protein
MYERALSLFSSTESVLGDGSGGQFVLVVPILNLNFVRNGQFSDSDANFD